MGLVAATAVAISACFATAAAGGVTILDWHVSSWLYPFALAPGLLLAALRPPGWVRPRAKGHETVFSIVLIASGLLIVLGFSGGARSPAMAPTAVAAVALVSLYWPDPVAIGVATMASLVYLLTGRHGSGAVAWTVVAVAAAAFAAVGAARLYRAQLPTYGSASTDWGRVARDGVLVIVVATLFGSLLAAVIPPPPPGDAGDRSQPGGPSALNPLSLGPNLNLARSSHPASDTVVLRVAAPEPDVWRAATFETWTGRSWRFSDVPSDEEDPSGAQDLRVPLQPGEVVDAAGAFRQRVTLETDFAQVVVAAPTPTRVVAPEGSYVLSYAGVLVQGPVMRSHSSYEVESSRTAASGEALRANDPLAASLPAELTGYAGTTADDRVRELAQTITTSAPTSHDKVLAVENWLATNTELRDSDGAVPRGRDVVSHFLFVDRGGRVERMATAMVVLLRSLGIPSRLAIGFRPGEHSAPGKPFTVRASDATAWAEVWFPTVGWQRFDPTGTLVARVTPESKSVWARLTNLSTRFWPALVAAVVAVLGWLLLRRARRDEQTAALPWATRFYDRLIRAGAKRDRPRRPHETPVEYTTALAQSAIPDLRLVQVGEIVTSAAYSGRDPSREQQQWAEAVLEEATATKAQSP